MGSSRNPIKALANRFVSLPPLIRMKITKTLLEVYTSEQSEKSFLERFWDEVEKAHGDRSDAVNPFTKEKGGMTGSRTKQGVLSCVM
jgi:hypothetical protein